MSESEQQHRWTDRDIRSQLERMLAHPEFRATDRMRNFLRFVVEKTLAGEVRSLKGFTIATEVFGRGEDFDAAHDPVVRIQAGRLRRAMERYYLVAGGNDPIVIDIPKGGYVPVFQPPAPVAEQPTHGHSLRDHIRNWPSLLVHPHDVPSDRKELMQIAMGLATELSIELANSGDLRVMLHDASRPEHGGGSPMPDFSVQVNVRDDGATMKIVVQLVSTESHELLWSDSIKAGLEDARLIEFQERTAAAIAVHIGSQHGAIYRAVTGVTTGRPRHYSGSYGAILKGHAYQQTFDPETYVVAFKALSEAHEQHPDCGLLSTMLAVMYIDNLSLEYFETSSTPLPKAIRLAHEGVRQTPNHPFCRLVLARAYLLSGDLKEGLEEVEAARKLNPDSILFLDVIGYLMALLGEPERGARLVRDAMALNPFYRAYARYATWLDCFVRGDYEAALEETEWFRGVGYFWAPLTRASTLGLLGRVGTARSAVAQVLELKPDFPKRGTDLIRRYIKDVDVERRFIEGLSRGGLLLEARALRQA